MALGIFFLMGNYVSHGVGMRTITWCLRGEADEDGSREWIDMDGSGLMRPEWWLWMLMMLPLGWLEYAPICQWAMQSWHSLEQRLSQVSRRKERAAVWLIYPVHTHHASFHPKAPTFRAPSIPILLIIRLPQGNQIHPPLDTF